MNPEVLPTGTLVAPPGWRTLDFISDLHLEAVHDLTVRAWSNYLLHTPADAVFILGDLFEVWVGDDCLDNANGFEARCTEILQSASAAHAIHVMHGNRDFLLGARFAQAAQVQMLPDPCLLQFAGSSWLLSHGDALCLDDTEYMAFRAQVRDPHWQANFLALPLDKRKAIARDIRALSEARKTTDADHADVDTALAHRWLAQAGADTLIHGHTHRPGAHALHDNGTQRVVLSDWDAAAQPARLQVLRLTAAGMTRIDL